MTFGTAAEPLVFNGEESIAGIIPAAFPFYLSLTVFSLVLTGHLGQGEEMEG